MTAPTRMTWTRKLMRTTRKLMTTTRRTKGQGKDQEGKKTIRVVSIAPTSKLRFGVNASRTPHGMMALSVIKGSKTSVTLTGLDTISAHPITVYWLSILILSGTRGDMERESKLSRNIDYTIVAALTTIADL
jgi:hypothetical protein